MQVLKSVRSSRLEMFCRKGVLRNFEKFRTPLVAVSEEWKKPGDNLYSGKRHENKMKLV